MNFNPIYVILMYLAMLFAPADVDRVFIEMPVDGLVRELVREDGKWSTEGDKVSIDGENTVIFGADGKEVIKITDFVALPENHDWGKSPTFNLGGGSVLRKVATGFIVKRKTTDGAGDGQYTIRYEKPAKEVEIIKVNVLGAVVNQGVYTLSDGGTVSDAIEAAGGSLEGAMIEEISIIEEVAGLDPIVTKVDLRDEKDSGLRIKHGDTIHVPSSVTDHLNTKEGKELSELAVKWLAEIDAENFSKSWDESSLFFRNAVTSDAWSEALKTFRKPLGGLKSRKVRTIKEMKKLPGAPDGRYFVMQFDASFEIKAKAVETVTFTLEEGGVWKASGYFIR